MNTLTPKRRHNDRGADLVEILVTVFLLSIVGALVTGTVISAMKSTRSTASGVEGQSELNDALSRIARDISVADPILATDTSWGTGVAASPSATELWMQSVTRYKCVRTHYYLETTSGKKALKSATQTFTAEACPDPAEAATSPTPVVKTIIRDFKDTDSTGTVVPLFTYYDKANNVVPYTMGRGSIAKIARVKIDVGSNVRERTNGVRLSTSATPRSLDGSLVTGVPAPACISYASADTSSTVIGADLSHAYTAAYVPSPIVSWKTADYGDVYVLRRQNTNGTWTTIPGATSPYTDTAMRGQHSRDFKYELDITGPGGSVTCGITVPQIANKPPATPVITATLTPDTSAGPHTADFTSSTVTLTWGAVAEAERYDIYRRPINADTAPFSAWIPWPAYTPTAYTASVTGTSYTTTITFDTAFEWMVRAVNTDWTAPNGTVGTPSADSNTGKTLAHIPAPTITNITTTGGATISQTGPSTYNENRVTWTVPSGASSIDGYRVFKRVNGTTTWTPASGLLTSGARTFLDTGLPLSSRYDYIVTGYNQGPRGTSYTTGAGTIYYGRYSNVVTILQYPAIPTAVAHGTENNNAWNPDGRNSVYWDPVPTATSYDVWRHDLESGIPNDTYYFRSAGAATSFIDTDAQPRGTRQYYAVLAQNATGWSPNHHYANPATGGALRKAAVLADLKNNITGATGADGFPDGVAYQRPNTPPMNWGKAPDLNVNAATGNMVTFTYTRNADEGEGSADKFCATAANLCTYQAFRDYALAETEYGNTGNGVLGKVGAITEWGSSVPWHLYSCNPGGCSGANGTYVNYYPGPYDQRIASFGDLRSLDQWGKGGAYSRNWTGDAGANFSWTRSYGANRWDISRQPIADDAFNYGGSQWYNQSGPYNQFAPGWSRTDTTNITGTNQQLENPDGSPVRVYGTPGSVQRYHINSFAPNGLNRYSYLDYQQKAAPVRFAETARFCNGTNTTMWRLGGRLNPQAALYDGVTGTARNTYTDHFRVTTVAGRQSGTGGAFTQLAADLENNSVSGALKGNPSAAGGGTFNDGAWNLDGGQDYFWMHEGMYNGSTGSAVYPGGIFSNSGATWNVPRQSYVGGAMRVTPILIQTGAHAVPNGDFNGISITLNEFVVNDQSFACSQSGGWAPELGSISRSGVIGGGSTIAPPGGGFGLPGN